jgi:gliding motility-associated-like protein
LNSGTILELSATTTSSTYLWQDGSTRPTYQVNKAGVYWVQVSNACGTMRDSVEITYKSSIPLITTSKRDTTLCKGNALKLQAKPDLSNYRWQDGSTGDIFMVNRPGIYWVEATNFMGTFRDSILVNYQSPPEVNLGERANLCNNEELMLDAKQLTLATTYLWQDGSIAPTFTVQEPGIYWVEVSNTCGTVRDSITVSCPACVIENMPNVITPNGDGDNDSFIIPCTQEQGWGIDIYNRWGKLVFHSTAYQGEWQAENLDSGIYYYTLVHSSTKASFKGVVHVLR